MYYNFQTKLSGKTNLKLQVSEIIIIQLKTKTAQNYDYASVIESISLFL